MAYLKLVISIPLSRYTFLNDKETIELHENDDGLENMTF